MSHVIVHLVHVETLALEFPWLRARVGCTSVDRN